VPHLLSEDVLEHYLKAGSIASEVRREIREIVRAGMPILQICERVESSIRRRGGEVAFPCNVCVNDIAAHYSSPPQDKSIIPKGAMVKVDIGVHVEGYIADTATTVSLNSQYDSMIYAVDAALEQAIRTIKPKTKTSEVGRTIKETIQKYGFQPIRNLSGHQMIRYVLHTGKSIPNVPTISFQSINEGDVFAVEPFLTLTSGKGEVRNGEDAYIYRFQKDRHVSNPNAEKLLKEIKSSFKSLPFSQRWIKGIENKEIHESFEELVAKRCVSFYPVLIEEAGCIVAQAEHTLVVTRDGCLVATR
jgi:methionyl aminopeptidase